MRGSQNKRGGPESPFSPHSLLGDLGPLLLLFWTIKLQNDKTCAPYSYIVISVQSFSHISGQVHQQHPIAHFMAIN